MTPVARLQTFAQRNILWALLICYALGMLWPAWGLWIRGVEVGAPGLDGGWALIDVMLGLLLFNAGLGLDLRRLKRFRRNVGTVLAGVSAGILIPLAFVLIVGLSFLAFPDWPGSRGLVMGLAVVAAMPAAGSSAAWSQNTEGNLSLSLALILITTALSPVVAGVVVSAGVALVGLQPGPGSAIEPGQYATTFLALWVLLPAVAGAVVRLRLGGHRVDRWAAGLKLVNLVNLLLLNYANASLSLPASFHRPSWGFLGLAALLCVLLCTLIFVSGGVLGRWLGLDRSRRVALCYGMGMRNNGAGLVLAGSVFRGSPEIMLPVIFYNIVQHAAAAVVARLVRNERGVDDTTG
jgi:BASS family bile acid:Na+ symporter